MNEIWLEVSNVRLENTSVQVQVKGDRTDREPAWWKVDAVFGDYKDTYRTITEGLDKKRVVIAKLSFFETSLRCTDIRVQYADSNGR